MPGSSSQHCLNSGRLFQVLHIKSSALNREKEIVRHFYKSHTHKSASHNLDFFQATNTLIMYIELLSHPLLQLVKATKLILYLAFEGS